MLVLEQCLGQAHDNDDSKALVFMAMSTLLSERLNVFYYYLFLLN